VILPTGRGLASGFFRQVVEKGLPWGKTLEAAEAKFKLSSVTIRKCMAEALPKGKETWPELLARYRLGTDANFCHAVGPPPKA
jgi:hypothetical protein